MNDRLGDLPGWTKEDGEDGDVELAEAPKQPKHMEHFFREVESIKTDIEQVRAASRTIGEINERSLQATTTEEENKLSHELRPLVDATNKRAKRTKTLLGLLKEENKKLLDENKVKQSDLRYVFNVISFKDFGIGGFAHMPYLLPFVSFLTLATNNSVRENLCNTLTRKFIDEMKLYQASQQKYKTDIKKKVARQVQIVKPDATDEEIDEVMRSEGGRDALYRQQILAGGVNDQVKTTYAKVAGKYQDVLALEQSVAELHQMFLDFALLTEQQGELLDQIEYQVRQAGDYVEDANVDVYEAIQFQKKIRKKSCWIILIVVVAIVVVLFATGIIKF
jgi:t-SNARE complex subunit (syntaxin)